MKFSIIVPVYNEEKTISLLISKLKKISVKNCEFELIAVDDASKDNTLKQLEQIKNILLLKSKLNRGKGFSIRLGVKSANGNYIIIQDADLEYNPNELPGLIIPIINKQAKVVYGSRFSGKITGNRILLHDIGNTGLTFLTNLLYGSNITDMETCYKIIPKQFFDSTKLNSCRFDIEPEMTAKILKQGYTIKEIPITYNARSEEEGKKINVLDGIIALFTLLKYRFVD